MSVIRSNMLVRRPMGLVATPTRMSSAGKKARKRLYATACAIMLVRGKTRPNTQNARFARAAEAIIARHYTYAERWRPETAGSDCRGDFTTGRRGWRRRARRAVPLQGVGLQRLEVGRRNRS